MRSFSFEQLKTKAEAKNLELARHPKGGFQIFFKGSQSTIHATDRLYGLAAVDHAIKDNTPVS